MQTYKSYSLPFIIFYEEQTHASWYCANAAQLHYAQKKIRIFIAIWAWFKLSYHNIEIISLVPPQQWILILNYIKKKQSVLYIHKKYGYPFIHLHSKEIYV